MAPQARSAPDIAFTARIVPMRADAFERMIYSAVDEPSDSVPALKAITVFGLIGSSLLVWAGIGVAVWQSLA